MLYLTIQLICVLWWLCFQTKHANERMGYEITCKQYVTIWLTRMQVCMQVHYYKSIIRKYG